MIKQIIQNNLEVKDKYEIQPLGENIDELVGQEVKVLIDTAYSKAQEILINNMDKLHAVSERLLEKEIISAEEFETFFK